MNRLANLLDCSRNCVLFICFWILEAKVNAHQLIAHWTSKLFNQSKHDRNIITYYKVASQAGQQFGGSSLSKTPRLKRSRLFALLRRLSPRNFMDYCVSALNEASGSASSNKFDLSTCNTSIWLLGHRYQMPDESEQLIDDIRSKLWITYRKNFPPLDENTRYTTDRGFGCMIRCGQMVLANAFLYKNLGRQWRWSPKGLDANPKIYSKILKLFQDRDDCAYSIHKIVRTGGQHEGKNVGEWFGPNTIAQALKRLSTQYTMTNAIGSDLLISIDAALDNMVVIDEIKSKFKRGSCSSSRSGDTKSFGTNDEQPADSSTTSAAWTPGILFIQLRLGLTKINPLYFTALKKTFQFENSLGIIGGRPNHALYLVGYTEDDIIYLDPHNTQQYIDFDADNQQVENRLHGQEATHITTPSPPPALTADSTYHCSCPERMPLDRLDPSLALCFYFATEEDFDCWCNLSSNQLIREEQAPMFEITHSRPSNWDVSLTTKTVSKSSSDHEEEFEILS